MIPSFASGSLSDVSRETLERLHQFVSVLEKWNTRINLISKSSMQDVWERHVLDSAQLFDLANPDAGHWVDIGSGGGFPGIVIAILAAEQDSPRHITMVESDQRKATFLRQVLREIGVKADVLSDRIEDLPPLRANTLSARALADLPSLCAYAHRHLAMGGQALFPKGANWKKELSDARAAWSFSLTEHRSQTDPQAVILEIGDLSHV